MRLSLADSPWIRKAYYLTLRTWLMWFCVFRQCDSQKCVKPYKKPPSRTSHYEHSDSIRLSLDTILSLFYTILSLKSPYVPPPCYRLIPFLVLAGDALQKNFSPNFALHFRSLHPLSLEGNSSKTPTTQCPHNTWWKRASWFQQKISDFYSRGEQFHSPIGRPNIMTEPRLSLHGTVYLFIYLVMVCCFMKRRDNFTLTVFTMQSIYEYFVWQF